MNTPNERIAKTFEQTVERFIKDWERFAAAISWVYFEDNNKKENEMTANFIRDAVEYIYNLGVEAKAKVEDHHGGLQYVNNGRTLSLLAPPGPATLPVHTLDALVAWFSGPESPVPDDAASEYFFIVEDHTRVLVFKAKDNYQDRHAIIKASFTEDLFPFDKYMTAEDFIINVQTKFVETPSKAAVIDVASKVRGEDVKQSEDNGIAQLVTVINKVGRLDETETTPIVKLQPRRTFAEVDQPESMFLMRLKKIQGEICMALFEADAGEWKVNAVKNIVQYIEAQDIIAEAGIQVIG